jgi:hypothetical protein
LTVSELRVAGSAVFAVSGLPATLRPGAAARVEVVFQPSAVGSHARQLKLIADAPGAPSADVDLRGHGVRGLANLSGDVVDLATSSSTRSPRRPSCSSTTTATPSPP